MPERFANLEELPYDPAAAVDSMICLRLPHAVHEALKEEADNLDVSLNAFVLSKVVAEVWPCKLLEDKQPQKHRFKPRIARITRMISKPERNLEDGHRAS